MQTASTRKACTWEQIPGFFNFGDIYQQAVNEAKPGSRMVEVGVFLGRSAAFMANLLERAGRSARFDAVDAFEMTWETLRAWTDTSIAEQNVRPWPALGDTMERLRIEGAGATEHERIARGLLELAGAGRVNVLAERGTDYAASLPDGSVDFAFLDADHSYEATAELIRAFLPKMKRGGVLAGHDAVVAFPGVEQAARDVLGDIEIRRTSFWWRKP